MKKLLIYTYIFSFLCACESPVTFSDKSTIAFSVFDETSEELKEKYGLIKSSIMESAPEGKYQELGLGFFKVGPLDKNEGRRLLLECTRIFLNKINSNKEFQSQLLHVPFTENNITLKIFIVDKDWRPLKNPHIGVLSMRNGMVYFRYNLPDEEYKVETEKETYEEALRITLDE